MVKIVSAGLAAPSGCNCQTTSFVIVDDSRLVKQIASMHESNKGMQQAKAYIACIVDVKPEAVYEGLSFAIEDCAAAVENILLAVTALGYSTVWIDGWLRAEDRARKIADLLAVPESKIVRILLPIGVAAENLKQPDKKPFEQRAFFNKFGI